MAEGLKRLIAALTLLTVGAGSVFAREHNDVGSLFMGKYPPSAKQLNRAVSEPAPWGPVAVLNDKSYVKTERDGDVESIVQFDYGAKGSLERVTVNSSSGIFIYTGNAITQTQKTEGNNLRQNYVQKEATTIEDAFKNDSRIIRYYDHFDLSSEKGPDSGNLGRAVFGYGGKMYILLQRRANGEKVFDFSVFSDGIDGAETSKYIELKGIGKDSSLQPILNTLASRINEQQDSYFPPMPSF
ncbi:MAG: hypothetical protein KGH55_01875 [Nanoarchaeota archaeon]|nr:hypothetical protein [Nanoarchaeota archaeon]